VPSHSEGPEGAPLKWQEMRGSEHRHLINLVLTVLSHTTLNILLLLLLRAG